MIAGSAAQALMTRRVGKNEQGELQGAISLLRSVGMLIGPLLFSGIFAYSVSEAHAWKLPSFAWFVAALLLVIAAAIAWRVTNPSDDVSENMKTSAALEDALVAGLPHDAAEGWTNRLVD